MRVLPLWLATLLKNAVAPGVWADGPTGIRGRVWKIIDAAR